MAQKSDHYCSKKLECRRVDVGCTEFLIEFFTNMQRAYEHRDIIVIE